MAPIASGKSLDGLCEVAGKEGWPLNLTYCRLLDGMRLHVKDVDYDRHVIIVRETKGGKDRVVMLPRSLAPALRVQLLAAPAQWKAIGRCNVVVSRCRTPWKASTPKWARRGYGFGCSRRQPCQSTRAVVWSVGTICLRSDYNAH